MLKSKKKINEADSVGLFSWAWYCENWFSVIWYFLFLAIHYKIHYNCLYYNIVAEEKK